MESASLPRHAAHVGAERQELLDAVKHGRKEPANPGEDGRQRWKLTHRGVVFVTDHTMTHEIVSWRIDGGGSEAILPAEASDAETGTHIVIVVDASGSMRKADVPNYPSRTAAVYDCLAKDFLPPQLLLQKARGGGGSSVIVTLIEMSDDAAVVFERQPLHEDLSEPFRERMHSRGAFHGNYIPALQKASEVLLKDRGTQRQLFLLFLSDGAPSDHVGKACVHGIQVWSQNGEQTQADTGRPLLNVCQYGNARCRNQVKRDW